MSQSQLHLGQLPYNAAAAGGLVPVPGPEVHQAHLNRVIDVQCVVVDDKSPRESFWVKVRLDEADFVLNHFLQSLRQNIHEKLRKLNIDACEIILKYLETNKPGKVFDIADSQAQWELFLPIFANNPDTIEFSAHIRRPAPREDDRSDGKRASTGKRKRGPTPETQEDLELLNALKEHDRKGFKFSNSMKQPEPAEPKRSQRQIELLDAFRKHVAEVWPGAVVINERLVTCPTCGKNRKLNHLRWIDTIKAGHGEKCQRKAAAAQMMAVGMMPQGVLMIDEQRRREDLLRRQDELQRPQSQQQQQPPPPQQQQHVALQQVPGLPLQQSLQPLLQPTAALTMPISLTPQQ